MEAVAAAASIAGIIAFAAQGLKAIDNLRDFCHNFKEDATKEFLRDLAAVANILVDVKVLCHRVDQVNSNAHADFRLSSLQLQVDDCALDLESWLRIAERLKRERPSKGTREAGASGTVRARYFNSFLTALSKWSRMKAQERLSLHQANIQMALAIFGRQFDLANTMQLKAVETTVNNVADQLSNGARDVLDRLDLNSDSGSSLLAHSRSTDERLEDIQVETSSLARELSDMNSLLLEALGSQPSRSCSSASRISYPEYNEINATKTGDPMSEMKVNIVKPKEQSKVMEFYVGSTGSHPESAGIPS